MQFHERKQLTENELFLAECNKYNPNYVTFPFEKVDMQKVTSDFKLLKKFEKANIQNYSNCKIPKVGDCIFLPDGQVVYFCHIHDNSGQTCAGGSYHLSNNGYISFSGGLDPGIKFTDLYLTEESYFLPIWFCHNGILCAGSAIYASIKCRVWKTKKGADLSGIPQVERLRKQKLKEKSESVVKIDSLGNPYQEHLPAVMIVKEGISQDLMEAIKAKTGLTFEDSYRYVPVYWCQPLQLIQIDVLKSFFQLTVKEEYDHYLHEPILIFRIDQKHSDNLK